ncbi:hypothetical protein AYO21_02727 [Fonsecaea monophora]|uniref:Uncharacterized protein n=1 Tax=Fonsecaea monophora TaxID=254056 RepID=A0A177FFX5_9EURO|nr:hypothetical protein AYO21_02727 [Fonsecaea monophora]OAG43108.1 hypothetical protein AYO21_02727 [Fonsecaea monophora]
MEALDSSKRQGHIKIEDVPETTALPPSEKGIEAPPPTRDLAARILNVVEKYWLFEFFGWTLALGCLIGTIALLAVHNGHEAPTWTLHVGAGRHRKSFDLTINTIISIFATAFNSGLLIPVAASISQLKWIWFQNEKRPLADFQKFESAARGPLGSLVLLWTLRCRYVTYIISLEIISFLPPLPDRDHEKLTFEPQRRLACLGAVIVIAALGTGFAFQALVVYPLQPVQVDIARIPRTNLDWGSNSLTTSISNDMVGAIYSGIYQYTDLSEVKNVSCPTGNCTWHETYTSMAVCSACHDVTASLQKSCGTQLVPSQDVGASDISLPYCNYSLPNGLTVSGVPSANYSSIDVSANTTNAIHFDGATALSVLSVIQTQWGPGVEAWGNLVPASDINGIATKQAFECGIYYCVQKFNTSVSRGRLSERVVDTYSTGNYTSPGVYALEPPTSFTNQSDPASYIRVYQSNNIGAMREFFATQWQGQVLMSGSPPTNTPTSAIALFLWALFYEETPLVQFQRMFASLAKSLSDTIRSYAFVTDAVPAALGAVYQDRPHVLVRWGWIALPAALLGLALVLLLGTMAMTVREHTLLWKASSLAAFSHPLTSDARAVVSDVHSPHEVLRLAQKMDVKWEKTDRGFRLVG